MSTDVISIRIGLKAISLFMWWLEWRRRWCMEGVELRTAGSNGWLLPVNLLGSRRADSRGDWLVVHSSELWSQPIPVYRAWPKAWQAFLASFIVWAQVITWVLNLCGLQYPSLSTESPTILQLKRPLAAAKKIFLQIDKVRYPSLLNSGTLFERHHQGSQSTAVDHSI